MKDEMHWFFFLTKYRILSHKMFHLLFLLGNTWFPFFGHETCHYLRNSPVATRVPRKHFIWKPYANVSLLSKRRLSFSRSYCFQKQGGLWLNSRCNYKAGSLPALCPNTIRGVLCSSLGKRIHFQRSDSVIIFLNLFSVPGTSLAGDKSLKETSTVSRVPTTAPQSLVPGRRAGSHWHIESTQRNGPTFRQRRNMDVEHDRNFLSTR